MAGKQPSPFTCPLCGKGYSALNNLNRHMKIHDPDKKVKCRFCSYETERMDNMKRHYEHYHSGSRNLAGRKRKLDEQSQASLEADSLIPGPSGYNQSTNRSHITTKQGGQPLGESHNTEKKEATNQHKYTATSWATGPMTPSSEAADQPSTTMMSDADLLHDTQLRQTAAAATEVEDANIATGTALDPLEEEELTDSQKRVEDGIALLRAENRRYIQDYHRASRRIQDRYNFELTTGNADEIRHFLRRILREQDHPFKVNASFGFILVNSITDQPIYYYASRNNRFLNTPVLIRTEQDIEAFMRYFEVADLMEHCRQQRPNTKFIVRSVTNVLFYIDKLLSFDIGCSIELPYYLRNRKCVVALSKDRGGYFYQDHFCLFRCLHYHTTRDPYPPPPNVKQLVDTYCQAAGRSAERFGGIKIGEIFRFEQLFEINVNIYQLLQYEDEETNQLRLKTRPIRKSLGSLPDTMNLNLYQRHFSYIKDMQAYAKTWECFKCRKLFNHKSDHDRHEKNCSPETKYIFPGGYGPRKTIFEELAEFGLKVDREKTFFPHRISFDFEALSIPMEDDRGKKEEFLREQEPASVSISSNVEGFTEPRCFISTGDPKAMVAEMYAYVTEIGVASYEILVVGFEDILTELDDKVNEYNELIQQANELRMSDNPDDAQAYYDQAYPLKIYKRLQKQLDQWLSRIPVLGFNSSRYDLNLIRQYLFPHFVETNIAADILKKGNDYLSVTTDHAIFLDIHNYVAANTSYSAWLKANDIVEGKGFFPYEWFTSLELLNQTSLPPMEAFWSELRQKNISAEDYAHLQLVWQQNGFQTMRDLLVWYNNKDVVPFLEAAEKMYQLWKSLNIDCFKSAISLPGLAMSYLVNEMAPNAILQLFYKDTKDIYETIRSNITGGLSIVVNRHQERNVTRLPNGGLTKWVYSHDANALYLWALGQPTGTGIFATWRSKKGTGKSIDWKRPDEHEGLDSDEERDRWVDNVSRNMSVKFHRDKAYSGHRTELEWLEWTSHDTRIKIEHYFNGRQKTLFETKDTEYPLDGYDPVSNTAYQFHGCYWHGHGCAMDSETDESIRAARRKNTLKVTDYINQQGLNIIEMYEYHRRRADADPNYKSAGESWKTIGNSTYGKSMTRKENFKDTVLATDEEAARLVNDKLFHKMEKIGDVAYEVCQNKSKIKMDLPISIAFFVYNYAKMRMLEFVYDFLKHYLKPGSYQLVCSDTDSIMAGYQSKEMDDLVKEELRDQYHREGKKAFLVTDGYTKRTPGLFKEERSGVGVVALCSKTYIHWNDPDDVKISSKGLSKVTNNFTKEDFFDVLHTGVKGKGTNFGIKLVKNKLVQYKQEREGLAYLYAKRKVLDDGVTTRALYL